MASTKSASPFPAERAIEMVAYPAVQILDVTGPLQVFASTNDLVGASHGFAPYAMRVVGRGGHPVVASAGLQIGTARLPTARTRVDTLMIAGGPGVDAAAADPVLVAWLRRRSRHARRTASVCTGALLLAATGLLDRRRAVTHWSFCDELVRRHPSVRVERDPIFVRDGPYWTSAGVTAGIDLALALVEGDLGRDVALAVARYMVVYLKRSGGQSQFSAALSLQAIDERFDALHRWIAAHLADDLSLSFLAARAGMSERSFSRRYVESTGLTPRRAVERFRVEAARHLLSQTKQPIKRIARSCGFGSEETMRRGFLRLLATTPQAYRGRFGA